MGKQVEHWAANRINYTIAVDWTVDGSPAGSGAIFDATMLASGTHQIVARAHDDTAWVPMDTAHGREELEQTVEWTITVS